MRCDAGSPGQDRPIRAIEKEWARGQGPRIKAKQNLDSTPMGGDPVVGTTAEWERGKAMREPGRIERTHILLPTTGRCAVMRGALQNKRRNGAFQTHCKDVAVICLGFSYRSKSSRKIRGTIDSSRAKERWAFVARRCAEPRALPRGDAPNGAYSRVREGASSSPRLGETCDRPLPKRLSPSRVHRASFFVGGHRVSGLQRVGV